MSILCLYTMQCKLISPSHARPDKSSSCVQVNDTLIFYLPCFIPRSPLPRPLSLTLVCPGLAAVTAVSWQHWTPGMAPGWRWSWWAQPETALKMSRRPPGPTNVDTRSLIEEGKPVLRPRTELRSSWAASLGSISEWRGASSMQSATQSIFGHIWVV